MEMRSSLSREIFWPTEEEALAQLQDALGSAKKGFGTLKAAFLSNTALKANENISVCSICCSMFKSKHALSEHVRFQHEVFIKCKLCANTEKSEDTFSYPSVFNNHLNKCHKSNIKLPPKHYRKTVKRPGARQDNPKNKVIRDYSGDELRTMLKEYCKSNGILIRQSSDEDSQIDLIEDYNSDEDLNRPSSNRNSAPEQLSNRSSPLQLQENDSVADNEEMQIENQNYTLGESENDIAEFHEADIDNETAPANTFCVINDSFNWFSKTEETINPTNLPAIMANQNATKSLLKALEKRFQCGQVDASFKVISSKTPEKWWCVDKFIWQVWTRAENLENKDHIMLCMNQDDVIDEILKIMYSGILEKSIPLLIEFFNLVSKNEIAKERIKLKLESLLNPAELTRLWNSDQYKNIQNDPTATWFIVKYLIKNCQKIFNVENGLLLIPQEILVQLLPEKLQLFLQSAAEIEPNVVKDAAGNVYLNTSSFRLIEYLFHWSLENAKLVNSKPTIRDLKNQLGSFTQLIQSECFMYESNQNQQDLSLREGTIAAYYYAMIFLEFSDAYYNQPAVSFHEMLNPSSQTIFLPIIQSQINSTHNGNPSEIEESENQDNLLEVLIREEFENQYFADIVFLTKNENKIFANSKIIEQWADNLIVSLIQEHSEESTDIQRFKVHCEFNHLASLIKTFYHGATEMATFTPFILYISTLYGIPEFQFNAFKEICHQLDSGKKPSAAMALILLHVILNVENLNRVCNRGEIEKLCLDTIQRSLEIVTETEPFLTFPNTATMRRILQLGRDDSLEFNFVFAIHRWCLAQERLSSGKITRHTLYKFVKPFLKLTLLTQNQRVEMQQETQLLTLMEYDYLVQGVWPAPSN